jgi:hypothetical protein
VKSPSSLLASLGDAQGSAQQSADRGALLGALTFIEGVSSGWGRAELAEWFREHLVAPGRMLRPTSVNEPPLRAISIEPPSATAEPREDELARLCAAAREKVVLTLRGMIRVPPDDRFLKAAIFADRVQRRRVDDRSVWVARPMESDRLSDVVLSLFAADMLMFRELHESRLCVCDVCGRVSYQPAIATRTGCQDHRPRSQTNSGFVVSTSKSETDEKKK